MDSVGLKNRYVPYNLKTLLVVGIDCTIFITLPLTDLLE